ncbi:MAG: hypothetical protein LM601_02415 [Candidatus Verstraetearchaeota archaeon]|jgi:hypothetical protein|nr:hypothetical protein [Candidatus Verstraetearchaeota archaeon]
MPVIKKDDFQKIYLTAKKNHLSVNFFFKNLKYILCINSTVCAKNKNFEIVSWQKAFGSKTPHEILTNFELEKIEVKPKGSENENEKIFNSIKEFINWIQTLHN